MKMFDFVSFCGVWILMLNHYADAQAYTGAKLVITDNNISQTVNFQQSESFLANNNLPIWIIQNGKLLKLHSESVMRELGPFTTYQDRDSSSAAVYFHNRREFDGIIDARYVIKRLSIEDNDTNEDNNVEEQGYDNTRVKSSIFERGIWGHADKTCRTKGEKMILTHNLEWTGGKLLTIDQMSALSYEQHPQKFYIETLIVINREMVDELFHEYLLGIPSVISYVLTLFNAVDMLFSKMNSLIIKINIAGIIIESDSVPGMSKCYNKIEIYHKKMNSIDAVCGDESLRSYLFKQRSAVPLDSYDVIVYLTRYPLHEHTYNEKTQRMEIVHLAGLTSNPPDGTYEYRRSDGKLRTGVMISDPESFGSFAIIAHEMVHALGVRVHDKGVHMQNGVCCEKLMKPRNGHCPYCLNWSDSTKILVVSLIRSPDGCIFKNIPRSLYPAGPRRTITANEQCQCYGYESAQDAQEAQEQQMFCWNTMTARVFGFCNAYLQCVRKGGKVHSVPVPMDGTPCEEHKFSNKVCWNRVCVAIEIKK